MFHVYSLQHGVVAVNYLGKYTTVVANTEPF
jgi:hypothetical protein